MWNKKEKNTLNLAEQVKVIERNKAGESMKKIADSLGVGKTQIQSSVKNTQTILDSWENGDNSERKTTKKRKCTYAVITGNGFAKPGQEIFLPLEKLFR